MRQRIRVEQPARRRDHRQAAGLDRLENRARIVDHDRGAAQPRRDQVRILIHREDGHPVRGRLRQSHPAIHAADGIREGPATRHDHEAAGLRRRGRGRERAVENLDVSDERSADLDDDVDGCRRVGRTHA